MHKLEEELKATLAKIDVNADPITTLMHTTDALLAMIGAISEVMGKLVDDVAELKKR